MKMVDSSDCDDDALPRMVSHPSGNQPRKRPGGSGTSTQCPSFANLRGGAAGPPRAVERILSRSISGNGRASYLDDLSS